MLGLCETLGKLLVRALFLFELVLSETAEMALRHRHILSKLLKLDLVLMLIRFITVRLHLAKEEPRLLLRLLHNRWLLFFDNRFGQISIHKLHLRQFRRDGWFAFTLHLYILIKIKQWRVAKTMMDTRKLNPNPKALEHTLGKYRARP